MYKVIGLAIQSKSETTKPCSWKPELVARDRKCQICGNPFMALNPNITSCEFCKTSFQAVYSNSYTPLLAI